MTVKDGFQINTVAIIGGGAAGITTLFELLNTKNDGSTTIRYKQNGELDNSISNEDPAFSKVVLFEQTAKIGGIWSPSFENPDTISQSMLETERYNDPYVLRPETALPEQFGVEEYTLKNPLETKNHPGSYRWSSSGIYKHLYSNVPSRYLKNSFIPHKDRTGCEGSTRDILEPLVPNGEITNRLLDFAEEHNLAGKVRFNSEVARICKTPDGKKWKLIVKHSTENGLMAQWYTEYFDAIVVATGHYSVPYVPHIKGLSSWNKELPSSVLHSKSYRNPDIFKDKVCLFVGTGLSGIDILQYTFPIAKQVIVSRTTGKEEIYKWLTNAANSDGIIVKPRIKEVIASNGKKIIFEDNSSVDAVDYIIFSTGYHWHYTFLNSEETGVRVFHRNGIPDGSSMIGGLYLNSFAIEDPTLAFVGVTVSPFKWPSFELAAATIAGVWTNNGKLPTKEFQVASEKKKIVERSKSVLYHYYSVSNFPEYVDEASEFLPKGRKSSDIFDDNHLDDMNASAATAERLFYQIKNKRIPIEATIPKG